MRESESIIVIYNFFAVSSHLSTATEVAQLLNDGMINNQSITMLLLNAF